MAAPRPPSARQVRISVACVIGWFVVAALVAALVVWTRSDKAPEVCVGLCLTDREEALAVAFLFGVPSATVGLIVAGTALIVTNRRFRSGLLAGTAASLTGLVLGPCTWLCGVQIYSIL
jgi:hypothetical protein